MYSIKKGGGVVALPATAKKEDQKNVFSKYNLPESLEIVNPLFKDKGEAKEKQTGNKQETNKEQITAYDPDSKTLFKTNKKQTTVCKDPDRKSWGTFAGGLDSIGGFTVGPDGFVYAKKKIIKGNEFPSIQRLGEQGIVITERFEVKNPQPNAPQEYVKLYFMAGSGAKTVTLPLNALQNLQKNDDTTVKLANAGFMIPASKNETDTLAGILQKMYKIKCSDGSLKTNYCEGIPGWNDDLQHIRPGSSTYAGEDASMICTQGSFKRYRSMLKKLLDDNENLILPFTFATAGYLKGAIWRIKDNITPVLNLYGTPSTGKSTATKLVTTMQTAIYNTFAASLVAQGHSTYVGMEQLLQANNNGFIVLDELGTLVQNEYNPLSKLMQLCGNGNRQKARGKVYRWDCTILANANFNIVNALSKKSEMHEALATRFLELDVNETPVFKKKYKPAYMHKTLDILNNNCGHLYPKIIKEVQKNHDKYLRDFQNLTNEVEQWILEYELDFVNQPFIVKNNKTIVSRFIEYYSISKIAFRILTKILDIQGDKDLYKRLEYSFRHCFSELLQQYNEKDGQSNAKEQIVEFFYNNIKHFEWKGPLCNRFALSYIEDDDDLDSQKKLSQKHNTQLAKQGGIWGRFKQSRYKMIDTEQDIEGELFINAEGETEAFKQGINVEKLAKQAESEGWLKLSKETRNKKVKVRGFGRCFCFYLNFAELEDEETVAITEKQRKEVDTLLENVTNTFNASYIQVYEGKPMECQEELEICINRGIIKEGDKVYMKDTGETFTYGGASDAPF